MFQAYGIILVSLNVYYDEDFAVLLELLHLF